MAPSAIFVIVMLLAYNSLQKMKYENLLYSQCVIENIDMDVNRRWTYCRHKSRLEAIE